MRHIFVGDNKPPLVELYRPGFNETFMAQSNITFTAQAFDDDGIAKVEFFAGNNLIGSSTTAPFTFLWKNVPVGDYSVTASATDNKGLSASTSPRTIHVIIPEITSFGLIDATKDEVIGGITDGAVLDLSMLPTYLNVKAYPTTNRVGSVVFMLDGKGVRLENGPPYALAGDNPTGDYHNWRPSLGDHTLTAIPYTKYNAKGLEGVGLTIHFKVIESGPTMFADNGGTPTPFEAPQFRIYPNPATQILNVSTSTFTSNSTLLLTIVNLQGEIVRKINLSNAGSVAHINISSLPAGSYLLKITNQGQMSTHRFVKLK